MRVRSAARLHRRDLFRVLDVGDIEDTHAAEAIFLRWRHRPLLLLLHLLFFCRGWSRSRWEALGTTVDAPIRHLYRHEQQVLIYRHIALPAGTYQRSQQFGLCRIGNVIDADAVEIPLEQMIALERQV